MPPTAAAAVQPGQQAPAAQAAAPQPTQTANMQPQATPQHQQLLMKQQQQQQAAGFLSPQGNQQVGFLAEQVCSSYTINLSSVLLDDA